MRVSYDMRSQRNFNPRSREGSDDGADRAIVQPAISIHAPVKGATCQKAFDRGQGVEFQSTLP